MTKQRGELHIDIVWEADREDFDRMGQWLAGKARAIPDFSQKGCIAIGVYNGDDKRLSFQVQGPDDPSPEAQKVIDEVFGVTQKTTT